jgi:hypothetical protein
MIAEMRPILTVANQNTETHDAGKPRQRPELVIKAE